MKIFASPFDEKLSRFNILILEVLNSQDFKSKDMCAVMFTDTWIAIAKYQKVFQTVLIKGFLNKLCTLVPHDTT